MLRVSVYVVECVVACLWVLLRLVCLCAAWDGCLLLIVCGVVCCG